jgi:hypothetical protein
MIWDRSRNTVALYINGKFMGGGNSVNTTGTSVFDEGGISFGTLYGWKHFGRRSLIRVYNRILSPAEVTQNFVATRLRSSNSSVWA